MKTEKISEIAYKRSVLKKVTDKIEGIKVGVDASYIKLEDVTAVMSSNFILSWFKGAEEFYVQKSINEIYVAGGTPKYLQLEITIPEEFPEKQLGRMVRNFNESAQMHSLQIMQCKTYISDITEPMVHINVLGVAEKTWSTSDIKPGMEVVMAGTIAIGATSIMTKKYLNQIKEKFNAKFVDDCLEISDFTDVKPIMDAVLESDGKNVSYTEEQGEQARCDGKSIKVKYCGKEHCKFAHCVGDRGVFSSAWELASVIDKGIQIELEKIPVWQETVEIAELFDYNPYLVDGTGAVLFVTENGTQLAALLNDNGFYANVIGKITDGNDRVVVHGDERRFLEPPRHNQLEEVFQRYK